MPDTDIGAVIAGPPEQDPTGNVAKWKDFLTRPENLSTALVLAASLAQPRRPGQTALGKTLESGVGALGFRGGLTRNIREQQAQTTERMEQSAQRQQAIAASQAQVSQGEARNRLESERLAQEAELAQTPRPLTPEQQRSEDALAVLRQRQAETLGTTTDPDRVPLTGNPLTDLLVRNAVENTLPGQAPDIEGAIAQGQELGKLLQAVDAGGTLVRNEDGTLELDISEEAARQLGFEVSTVVPEPTSGADEGEPQARAKPDPQKLRRIGGIVARGLLDREGEERVAVNRMRRQPGFEDMDEKELLDRVGEARALARTPDDLRRLSVEQLESLLDTFSKVFSALESAAVRRVLAEKRGPSSTRHFGGRIF